MAAASNALAQIESGVRGPDGLCTSATLALRLHDYPSPKVEKLWREFLKRIDSPSHYDAPEYFLEPYWAGKRPFVVLALNQGRVIGVLSGIHTNGSVQCGLPARPQIRLDETDGQLATDLLAEELFQEAGHEKLIAVYAWSGRPLVGFERRGFLSSELEGNVVLDLRLGADELFKQFRKNRRRDIRIATKNGVDVTEATTSQDLAAYWDVYSAWRQTTRKKIDDNASFATKEKVYNIRETHRFFLARVDGKVIAASGLRFLQGGMVEYAGNCSRDEFIYLCPNDLLVWTTIRWACNQGFTKFSLGGAHQFLRKWGGNVVPICRYRLDRSFLRRHDLEEDIMAKARFLLGRAPEGVGRAIRKMLGKN